MLSAIELLVLRIWHWAPGWNILQNAIWQYQIAKFLSDEAYTGLLIFVDFDFQTHPNIDKKLFNQESLIGLKQPSKPFPLNNDIGVLKWRLQSTDEGLMPLSSKILAQLTPHFLELL